MPPVSEVELAVPKEGAGGLSRSDCLCPVCLEIFLEPVTLPCSHTFCKSCFLETVDKANMCCPLCRKRVSTWARLNSRNKTLVNKDLWQRIQNAFPEHCQRRLSGQDDDYPTLQIATPKVCQPGELRREYEDEVSKLEKERQAQEEAERRASEEYIQRLLAEDEQRLAEERRKQEESQQQDEQLARQISQELNSDAVSHVNSRPIEISPPQKKKPSAGDIQKFFGLVQNRHTNASDSSQTSSLLANKENIRDLEISLLSPARSNSSASRSLPTLDYYGPQAHGSREQFPDNFSPPCSPSSILSFSSSNDFEILDMTSPERSTLSSSSAKRKSEAMEEVGAEGTPGVLTPKRPCAAPSEASTSVAPGPSLLQQLTQQEEELQERRRQEKEDRQLALRLQRELDREERLRATDRSKSSTDPYQLRQKTPHRSNKATPLTPPITPCSSSSSSPSSSSSSSSSIQRKDQAARRQKRPQADQGKAPKRRQSAPPAAPATRAGKISASPASASATPTAAAGSPTSPVNKGGKQITITDLFSSWAR